jgi:glycerophosphoryl diester phosphodiesterase
MSTQPGKTFTPLTRPQVGRPLCIAHRGASAYAPENSLMAFEKAAEMQADMVEIDLRLTADNVVVVSHDDTLMRVFGVASAIADLTFDQLQAAIPAGFEPIPTFEKVAEVCARLKLGLYLDIKSMNRQAAADVLETLARHGLQSYSIFGSFRPDWIADLKAQDSTLLTSILFGSLNVDPVLLAQAIHCDYVHPCWERAAPQPYKLLTVEWMKRVRDAGLGIICWHEERPEEMAALRDQGVDGICSDTPDVLYKMTSW